MEKIINVNSLFENKGIAVTYEQAKPCYEKIKEELLNNEIVILDFVGLNIISSPFLNGSIGLLLKDYSEEEIKKRIVFKNIPTGFNNVLEIVINNASKFYKK